MSSKKRENELFAHIREHAEEIEGTLAVAEKAEDPVEKILMLQRLWSSIETDASIDVALRIVGVAAKKRVLTRLFMVGAEKNADQLRKDPIHAWFINTVRSVPEALNKAVYDPSLTLDMIEASPFYAQARAECPDFRARLDAMTAITTMSTGKIESARSTRAIPQASLAKI